MFSHIIEKETDDFINMRVVEIENGEIKKILYEFIGKKYDVYMLKPTERVSDSHDSFCITFAKTRQEGLKDCWKMEVYKNVDGELKKSVFKLSDGYRTLNTYDYKLFFNKRTLKNWIYNHFGYEEN